MLILSKIPTSKKQKLTIYNLGAKGARVLVFAPIQEILASHSILLNTCPPHYKMAISYTLTPHATFSWTKAEDLYLPKKKI